MTIGRTVSVFTLGVAVLALAAMLVQGSSHREAPFITEHPKVDGTDFYMFRSYETGREAFVTLIANYLPLQDPYGGPNYFFLDPEALYEIHIDNNGDAVEDITFQFRFQTDLQSLTVPVGEGNDVRMVTVPVLNFDPNDRIGEGGDPADRANLNIRETYTVMIVRGDRRTGTAQSITNGTATNVVAAGASTFVKPVDNIGNKSLPDYGLYANAHIYDITIPGCNVSGSRMFVGQRREPFAVNLGEVFDLINLNPLGNEAVGGANILDDKNITSLILEVPIACLTASDEPVIGGWTTASLRQARVLNPEPRFSDPEDLGPSVEGGAWTQVSRLANPLVNELVIGLPAKDRFNASEPMDDAQFLEFVTHPTLPEIISHLPTNFTLEALEV